MSFVFTLPLLSRPLLFQSLDEIKANLAIGDSLQYTIVLHFLFSKASLELRPPHVVSVMPILLQYFLKLLENIITELERITNVLNDLSDVGVK